jgi:predicted N-acetyltransferase YhbS
MLIRAETRDDRYEIAAVTRAAFAKEDEVRMIALIRASAAFEQELSHSSPSTTTEPLPATCCSATSS